MGGTLMTAPSQITSLHEEAKALDAIIGYSDGSNKHGP